MPEGGREARPYAGDDGAWGESQGQGPWVIPTKASAPEYGMPSSQWRQQRAAARLLPSITVNGPESFPPTKTKGQRVFPSANAR